MRWTGSWSYYFPTLQQIERRQRQHCFVESQKDDDAILPNVKAHQRDSAGGQVDVHGTEGVVSTGDAHNSGQQVPAISGTVELQPSTEHGHALPAAARPQGLRGLCCPGAIPAGPARLVVRQASGRQPVLAAVFVADRRGLPTISASQPQ